MTQTIKKIAYEADLCRDCIKADCADGRAFAEFECRYSFVDKSECETCNSVFNIKKTQVVYPEWVNNMQNISNILGVEVVICDPTDWK